MATHNDERAGNETRNYLPGILSLLTDMEKIEFEHFAMEIGDIQLSIPMGNGIPKGAPRFTIPGVPSKIGEKPLELFEETYAPPVENFPCNIKEVRLGATKNEGGSRGKTYTLGGSNAPPFVYDDKPPVHLPVFAMDIFDMNIPMPAVVKADIKDVMDDPAEWAKRNVEKFGADMVTVHLVSTDPLGKDTSPAEAARTVENVLQAVDVPLIIGGCGDPHKDAAVFARIAEVASGERLLLNSLTLDMASSNVIEPIAKAAKENGHAVIGLSGLDLNKAKELNRRLLQYLPPEDIVMDLTTVALGYGLEYSFSIHERARYAALMGDEELQQPTISAASNAWVAREARIKMDPVYGPKEFRGPIWETISALSMVLAGVDIFMLAHPTTLNALREIVQMLVRKEAETPPCSNTNWCTTRI